MGFSKKSDRLPVLSYTLYVPATEAELGFEGTGGSVLFVNAGGFNLRVSVTDWDLGYLNDGNEKEGFLFCEDLNRTIRAKNIFL